MHIPNTQLILVLNARLTSEVYVLTGRKSFLWSEFFLTDVIDVMVISSEDVRFS